MNYADVNGRLIPSVQATLSIHDRATLFGDAAYEVIALYQGKLVDADGHLARLERSLREIEIMLPLSRAALLMRIKRLCCENKLWDGLVYMQVSRGSAKRDFAFPKNTRPTVMIAARAHHYAAPIKIQQGIKAVSVPDLRWARRDIKATSLLPQVLAKHDAAVAGGAEAWLVGDDGLITEGGASNAWIVKKGTVYTHPVNHRILNGITRATILQCAQKLDISVVEKPFALVDSYAADEAFISSATNFVMPVTQIDDKLISGGVAGSISLALRRAYMEYIETYGQSITQSSFISADRHSV